MLDSEFRELKKDLHILRDMLIINNKLSSDILKYIKEGCDNDGRERQEEKR